MQYIILLVSASAIFIFGYFLMKKLDDFLENNWNEQEHTPIYSKHGLRIGVSTPLIEDSLSDVLETYEKQHPDISIHIFNGEDSELCKELETHNLDMIFLPENTAVSKKTHYHSQTVPLRCSPVVIKYTGWPLKPITQNQISQKALWRNSEKSPVIDSLIRYLNKFAEDQSQM